MRNSKDEQGIFIVLVAIFLAAMIGLAILAVDIFMLIQSQMDLRIAAQQAAGGAMRHLVDPATWHDSEASVPPSLSSAQVKMEPLVTSIYVLGKDEELQLDSGAFSYTMNFGTWNAASKTFSGGTLPATVSERKSYGNVPNQIYPAIRVRLNMNPGEDAGIVGALAKFYNSSGYMVSTEGIVFYDSFLDAGGVLPYAIGE